MPELDPMDDLEEFQLRFSGPMTLVILIVLECVLVGAAANALVHGDWRGGMQMLIVALVMGAIGGGYVIYVVRKTRRLDAEQDARTYRKGPPAS